MWREGIIYQFLSLCFGLATAPLFFTRRLKIRNTFSWRMGIVIYLGAPYWLLAKQKGRRLLYLQKQTITVALLLQSLECLINKKRSALTPVQETFSPPHQKKSNFIQQIFQDHYNLQTTNLKLTKVMIFVIQLEKLLCVFLRQSPANWSSKQ